MSDYEDEYGSGTPLFIKLISAVVILIVIGLIAYFALSYFGSDTYKNDVKNYELKVNQTKSIVNDPNISCKTLIELRVNDTQKKIDLEGLGLLSQVRDLYNAKSCGTHWGWFEP